jgi:ATP-dependent protease HslVU (ClpYQ) peptidase subunit
MKPVTVFIVVAISLGAAALAATAKTVTTQTSTNDRMVSGVAGPVASADTSQHKMKAEAKKAKDKANMAATRPIKPAPIID